MTFSGKTGPHKLLCHFRLQVRRFKIAGPIVSSVQDRSCVSFVCSRFHFSASKPFGLCRDWSQAPKGFRNNGDVSFLDGRGIPREDDAGASWESSQKARNPLHLLEVSTLLGGWVGGWMHPADCTAILPCSHENDKIMGQPPVVR